MVARLPAAAGDGEVAERIRARRGGTLYLLDELLLHSPPVADGWNQLLGAIRQRITLPAAIWVLVVLRIAVLNRAAYEWVTHRADARRARPGAAARDPACRRGRGPGLRRGPAPGDHLHRHPDAGDRGARCRLRRAAPGLQHGGAGRADGHRRRLQHGLAFPGRAAGAARVTG